MEDFPAPFVECNPKDTKVVNDYWWQFFDKRTMVKCYSLANYKKRGYTPGMEQSFYIDNYTYYFIIPKKEGGEIGLLYDEDTFSLRGYVDSYIGIKYNTYIKYDEISKYLTRFEELIKEL